jgi:hypothetical protein
LQTLTLTNKNGDDASANFSRHSHHRLVISLQKFATVDMPFSEIVKGCGGRQREQLCGSDFRLSHNSDLLQPVTKIRHIFGRQHNTANLF